MNEGIPYNLSKGTALLEQAVAKDAIAYMRLMVNTRDDASFERVCNNPKRGLGKPCCPLPLHPCKGGSTHVSVSTGSSHNERCAFSVPVLLRQ